MYYNSSLLLQITMKIHSGLSIPICLTLSCLLTTSVTANPFGRPDFFERGRRDFEQEIRRFEQEGAVTTPSITVDESALPWSRVVMDHAGFTAMLPSGAITQEAETVEFPKGNVNFDIIATHPPSSRFVIAYSEEVTPETFANTQEVLERARDYIIENEIDLVKVADEDITFEKYPGKEFKLQNKEETFVFRLLLVGQRLYVLAVSHNNNDNNTVSSKSIDKFFNSFKLIN